eukprot:CAMPEP_0118820104 /NCGR_PEP_ID=MMETSP1162-20130426/7467_1 /TAXON_ID=33656 /ORGANISM="Phaeocystis Sp, Strain CCMP2710" /LENGTH=38 /DNA_ID= /DNA_START= /DNA_END= /DNA_ORIENTATION=
MIAGGQHDHLVAVHCDVTDGSFTLRGCSGLNRGDDLQV